MKPSTVLLRWKATEFASVTGHLDKRSCCLPKGRGVVSVPLTGHGGEGDEVGSSVALGVWRRRREIS
jgi:hypothetical protein